MTTSSENLLAAFQMLIRHTSTELLTEILFTLHFELMNRSNSDVIFSVWQVADVQELRPDLTEDQCREILRSIERNHDAGIGINWHVIDDVAEMLFPEPENLPERQENSAD